MKTKKFVFVCVLLTGLFAVQITAQTTPTGNTTSIVYDSFQKAGGGYTLAEYSAKWSNIYGRHSYLFQQTNSNSRRNK